MTPIAIAGAGVLAASATFDLPPAPSAEALLRFAAQAGVSIGGDLRSCGPALKGLRGRMEPTVALRRLLAKAPCEALEVAPGAFRISAKRLPPRATAPRERLAGASQSAVSEVIVTAARRRTALDRYAGAAEVAEGGELTSAGRVDLDSLAGAIPMLAVTNLGPGRDKFFLRGVSDGVFTGASVPTVATYLDDLPLTYNAPDPDLKLVDVERVEVVAGPQGALYGAGAIGGVLRIISRRPDLERSSGEMAGEVSSTAHGGIGRDVEGSVNMPLAPGRLALRASAYGEDDAGWLDSPKAGRSDSNGTVRFGSRAALLWRASKDWVVQLSAAGQSLKNADSQYVLAGQPELVRSAAVQEPHDNDFATVSLDVTGDLPLGRLKLAVAHVTHHASTRYDASDVRAAFGADPAGAPAAYDETNQRGLTFGEASLASSEGGRSTWLAGIFVASSDDAAHDRLGVLGAPLALYDEARADAADEQALYAEYGRRIGRRLTVRVGARLSHATLAVRSQVTEPALTLQARNFTGTTSTLRLLPRLAIEFEATPRLFLYFDATDGYRPAGLNTAGPLSQTFDAPGAPTRNVRSDVARSYELGARWTASPRFRLSSSLFYTDWLGVRSDQYTTFGLPYTVNVGDARIDGGTLALDWSAGGGVEVRGSAFAAEPQLTTDRNLSFLSRSDAGLPGVSGLGAALNVGWTRRFGSGVEARVGLRADYVGRSTITFDAATKGAFGDYVEGGVSAELRRGALNFSLLVQNLMDQRADTFAFGNPFSFPQQRQLTPLRPRTVTFRISRDF